MTAFHLCDIGNLSNLLDIFDITNIVTFLKNTAFQNCDLFPDVVSGIYGKKKFLMKTASVVTRVQTG